MDFLNSQLLTALDGYFHMFSKQGDYKWGLGSIGSFTIKVQPADSSHKPTQTDIRLQFNDSSMSYEVLDPQITIFETDFVLWTVKNNSTQAPAFSIVGGGAGARFSNAELAVDDAFSHFFMLPGEYKYVVSGGSLQNGTISVVNGTPSHKAVMVAVESAKPPDPDPVQIIVGDTIHWHIMAGQKLVIRSAD